MNYCIEYGDKAGRIFNPTQILENRFYIRAKYDHIIANYVPMGNELDLIKPGHKVHVFITNMNLMELVVLIDFIKDAYARSKRKVILHIPTVNEATKDTIMDVRRIFYNESTPIFKIYNMKKDCKFIYRDNDGYGSAKYVRVWTIDGKPAMIYCMGHAIATYRKETFN